MEIEEYLDKEKRQSILRQSGIKHERDGLSALTEQGRALLQSMPVIPDPDPPAQDPATGLPVFTLGITPLQ